MRIRDLLLNPSCLVGPLVWFKNSEPAQIHRHLITDIWPKQSRWQWYPLLLVNIVSWYLFLAWYRIFRVTRTKAFSNDDRGFSIQLSGLLYLSLVVGAPPSDYYRYQLYRIPKKAWLGFVFSSEEPGWHRVFSCPLGSQGSEILKDKLSFEKRMAEHGLLATETLFELEEGLDESGLFDKSVFIKPRSLNAMRGCALLSIHGGDTNTTHDSEDDVSLKGRDLSGQSIEIKGRSEISAFISKAFTEETLLAQKVLTNSVPMADFCACSDLVTLRIISGIEKHKTSKGDQVFLAYAILEIPIEGEEGWDLYPVNLETGVPSLSFEEQGFTSVKNAVGLKNFSEQLPEYDQLQELIYSAHRLFPDIATIGWDVCHTEAGWTLIEGNTAWNLCIPQFVSGVPLLKSRLTEIYISAAH